MGEKGLKVIDVRIDEDKFLGENDIRGTADTRFRRLIILEPFPTRLRHTQPRCFCRFTSHTDDPRGIGTV
jgi:hypothetical protein